MTTRGASLNKALSIYISAYIPHYTPQWKGEACSSNIDDETRGKQEGEIYFVLKFERLHTSPESENASLEFKRYIYITLDVQRVAVYK